MAIDRSPRIIVMEQNLPDVDATSLVTELRQQIVPPGVPIVVLARATTPRQRARLIWAGANAIVAEPHDCVEIRRTVGMVLKVSCWR
ncbi:MAG TPA: hypothetical protein VNC61_14970 [Acidimicrobiales bacterium]|nr:hypothetical protein [Acidimicrobiales bacterium]